MKRSTTLIAMGLSALLAGCIPTLHPLYTEQDLTFDPALVGRWAETDSGKESWDFSKGDAQSYQLIYTDGEGKKGEFAVRLLKLGDTRFLDLYPNDTGLKDGKRNDYYNLHFIPAHTFLKVLAVSPTLRLSVMEPDWLGDLLKKDPKALAHEREDDRVLITASTKDLQQFVLRYANATNAWGRPSDLHRAGAGASQ